ncbi:hypothetical protein [Pinibacter soli]|uniref:Uncharacterized protein n=1 Tax=Pinibacter soli TaxID=3044211 RepID=A0ABT6RBL9_9BACT|nr:hypothetical protein [Pinibacter soli]MDI3319968.1 hypothetical protein [Pinibacter soli]
MTLLDFSNKFVFQFLFFRLARVIDERRVYYSLMFFVIPLTGYNKDFRFVGGKKQFVRITKGLAIKNK